MVVDGRPTTVDAQRPVATRDRATMVTYALLVAMTAIAWIHVVSGMGAHGQGALEGMPASLGGGVAYVAGWAVMMAAMMLPSALPMIALYGAIQRKAVGAGVKGVHVAVFTLTYLGLWGVTGVPVYLAGMLLGAVAAGRSAPLWRRSRSAGCRSLSAVTAQTGLSPGLP